MRYCPIHSRGLVLLLGALLSCTAYAAERQPVTLETFDGVTLAADFYPPPPSKDPAPMVILLHMYRSDKSAWAPLTDPLHEAGFAVLAIDLRGHGDSATPELRKRVTDRDPELFDAMYNDVRAAYDWLALREDVDRSRFALVGASVGCSVALRYAQYDRSVDAIACLSPGINYLGLDSKRDMSLVKGRKIWLCAARDPQESEGVRELAPLAEGVTKRLVPGKLHGTNMFGKIDGIEREITQFLVKNIGEPTDRKQVVYGSIRSKVYHLAGSGWIERIAVSNLRHYSSAEEAEARGLRKSRSQGPNDHHSKDKKDGDDDDDDG